MQPLDHLGVDVAGLVGQVRREPLDEPVEAGLLFQAGGRGDRGQAGGLDGLDDLGGADLGGDGGRDGCGKHGEPLQ